VTRAEERRLRARAAIAERLASALRCAVDDIHRAYELADGDDSVGMKLSARARRALEEWDAAVIDDATQIELLPIEHRTLNPDRLKNFGHVNPEAIYLAEWRRFNRQTPNLLNVILAPSPTPSGRSIRFVPGDVSRRDAVVVATFVQWLGTNVGRGFIAVCQRIVDEADRLRLEIGVRRNNARGPIDQLTPLQRRKARLDAARKRIADSLNKKNL
jgi:hypothetical protein